jgi:glycine/D-amino acid oxidase-like deaminating enzyme
MAGITTAYHILRSDPSLTVLVLEARDLCSGATGRNGGHSKVKTATLAEILAKAGPEAADLMKEFVEGVIDCLKTVVEEEGLDCEFELRRSFDVFTDDASAEKMRAVYEDSRREGRRWTRDTGFVDARYVEQVTSVKGARGALSVPACSLWPYRFVTRLVERMVGRYRGLNVQTHTPVVSVSEDGEGGSVIATPRGEVRAGKVVFATNAYTAGLVPGFRDVIVPVRGMATHLVPDQPVRPHLGSTYNIDFGPGKGVDYLNPRPDGGIVVGGAKWMFEGDKASWFDNFDDSVGFSDEVQRYWDGYMQRTFAGWEESGSKVERTWVGIMGVTPDGWPHVGRVPGRENQWVLAGFNGGGMAMIPTVSKAVARMVVEDVGFEEVGKEMGVPAWFASGEERLETRFEKKL